MAAQYSLPFSLATSLLRGPEAYESYAEETLGNADILTLSDRIDAVEDLGLEDAFPSHFGSWVELTTRSGETRRSDVLDSVGTPAQPIPDDGLRAKFESLTQKVMPDLNPNAVYAAVDGFDGLADAAELTRLFAAK